MSPRDNNSSAMSEAASRRSNRKIYDPIIGLNITTADIGRYDPVIGLKKFGSQRSSNRLRSSSTMEYWKFAGFGVGIEVDIDQINTIS